MNCARKVTQSGAAKAQGFAANVRLYDPYSDRPPTKLLVALTLTTAFLFGCLPGTIAGQIVKAQQQSPVERLCYGGLRVERHGEPQCPEGLVTP
jgi:hypothetical protein